MDNLLGIWKVFRSGEATGIIQLLAFDLSVGRAPITTCMRSRSVFWNQKAARESRHISRPRKARGVQYFIYVLRRKTTLTGSVCARA